MSVSFDFKRRTPSKFYSLHPGFFDIKSNSPRCLMSKMTMQTEINAVVMTLFSKVLQEIGKLMRSIASVRYLTGL